MLNINVQSREGAVCVQAIAFHLSLDRLDALVLYNVIVVLLVFFFFFLVRQNQQYDLEQGSLTDGVQSQQNILVD